MSFTRNPVIENAAVKLLGMTREEVLRTPLRELTPRVERLVDDEHVADGGETKTVETKLTDLVTADELPPSAKPTHNFTDDPPANLEAMVVHEQYQTVNGKEQLGYRIKLAFRELGKQQATRKFLSDRLERKTFYALDADEVAMLSQKHQEAEQRFKQIVGWLDIVCSDLSAFIGKRKELLSDCSTYGIDQSILKRNLDSMCSLHAVVETALSRARK